MGTLTLDDLKDELRSSMGGRTDHNARLTRVLNLAQMRIARLHRWEELEEIYQNNTAFTSTPASDKYLAFPANVRDIYSVILLDGTNSRKLQRIPNRLWDRRLPAPHVLTTGRPSHYTLWRNVMELWRVPNAVYALEARGVKWPLAFSDSTPAAVSDLDRKDDLLVSLAMSYLFATLKQWDEASRWWTIYREQAREAGIEETEKPDLDFGIHKGAASLQIASDYWKDPFIRSVGGD